MGDPQPPLDDPDELDDLEDFPPPRPLWRDPWLIGGLLVGVVGLAVFLIVRGGATYEIDGQLTAPECTEGYAIEGAAVTVRDQDGKVIGSGSTTLDDDFEDALCRVAFVVEVPRAEFYQFEIGTHGGPSYSFEELESLDWVLRVSLGG